ncbi:hypothetical protein QBC35DRAFT_377400 [Podospora australis]|uniref:Dystroglycan-type cadherin-like domain-containing protein n=1 Tax=Podospora australis TaxID=1536484 RepID=A0AAN6WYU9_9PEZI|nr:hypothetical protein QBC35DRAFT_377400 [Podospora australis]
MQGLAVAVWTVLVLAGISTAVPGITFPINSQVPPVARIGEPFTFVFSPSTFTSGSAITYSLSNAPRWLSIDSGSRRLFGTPREEDVAPGQVVGVPVNLVAMDESGSTTHAATLVVSRNRDPKLELPLDKQVPDFGVFSAPSSLLAGPDKPFSFSLDQKTFSNPSGNPLGYYAIMADNTPLPAWISFDSGKLSFTGRTPPIESLIQPPQRFSFHLIATDVEGFEGAFLGFDIVVGVHHIAADDTIIILTAAAGKTVSYTKLRESIKVDGQPVAASDDSISLASTLNMPSWLSVDEDTWNIKGIAPEKAVSTNFTITFRDEFFDSLNVTVMVEVADEEPRTAGVFQPDVKTPTISATAGKHFSVDLDKYLVHPHDVEITTSFEPSTTWIRFDRKTNTISGDPPPAPEDSAIRAEITAKSKSTKKSDTLSLIIRIRAAASDSTSDGFGTSSADPTSTSTAGETSVIGDGVQHGQVNVKMLTVLFPSLVALFAGICFIFWCFRRRDKNRRPKLTTRDISGPLPGSFMIKSGESPHGVPPSLPEFGRNFDRSFSVSDVFTSEKKSYVDSRSSFFSKTNLPTSGATVKLLPPSVRSRHGSGRRGGVGRTPPFLRNGSFGGLRMGSSLGSIAERSASDEASDLDERTIGLLRNDCTGCFRDGVEINVPRAVHRRPDSAHGGDSSPESSDTDTVSSPRSPLASDSSPETLPLRAESRLAYHPPEPPRRTLWPWLRGSNANASRSSSRLLRWGSRAHSKKPSTSTIDTFAYKKQGSFPGLAYANRGQIPKMTPPPPAKQVPLARPVTRRGPVTNDSLEGVISGRDEHSSASIPMDANRVTTPRAKSVSSKKEISLPVLPNWRDTPDDFWGLSYEELVHRPPLLSSDTWSTVAAEDWVDESVQSFENTPNRSLGVSLGTDPRSNWRILHDSPSNSAVAPIIKDWDEGTEPETPKRDGGGAAAGFATSSGAQQQPAASSSQDGNSGNKNDGGPRGAQKLGARGHSKGKSLASEMSKESDYVVYI